MTAVYGPDSPGSASPGQGCDAHILHSAVEPVLAGLGAIHGHEGGVCDSPPPSIMHTHQTVLG